MDLLQLQYFLALANLQHVTKTAEMLHISQPALSLTIKKLETQLDVPLFIRKGRSIALSPYGEAFKVYAEEAILSLENGKQVLSRMKGESSGALNLGLLSPYIWNDLFTFFNESHPNITINRRSIEDHRFLESLLNGEIDFYLGGLNLLDQSDNARLQHVTLYEDDMVLLVRKDHPFAGRSSIDLRECRNEAFVNLSAETNLQQFNNRMFRQAGFDPKVVLTCDYTLRDRMVSEGHGVSVTTLRGALKSEAPDVVPIPLSYPAEKRKLGLVWRKGRVFSEPMEQFLQLARQYYTHHDAAAH